MSAPVKPGKTVSLALVELRCARAAEEIDRVRRLLHVATGAIVAKESDEGFELPEDALTEVLGMAESRLDAVSDSLDSLRLKAEPTREESEQVAIADRVMGEISEGKAARRAQS